MSLLIEALKQAEARKGPKAGKPAEGAAAGEQGKPEAGQPASKQTEEASAAPAKDATPAGNAGGGLELSLAPQEERTPAAAVPEPAGHADSGSGSGPETASPATPEPREVSAAAEQTVAPASAAQASAPDAPGTSVAAPRAEPAGIGQPAADPAPAATGAGKPAPASRAASPSTGKAAPSPAAVSRDPAAAAAGRLQTGSDASRRAAREVLAAAQQRTHPGRTRQRVLLGVVLLLAALMSVGGWWLTRPGSSLGTAPIAVAPVSDEVLAEAQMAAEPAPAVDQTSVLEPANPAALPVAVAVPGAAEASAQAESAPAAAPATTAEAPAAASAPANAGAPSSVRTAPPPSLGPAPTLVIERARQAQQPLLEGYAALNRGELDTARRAYQLALQGHPRHPDALLGLAVIAEREGDLATAARRYREVLKVDPRNPTALSALLGSGQGSAGVRSESQLREALAAQPRSAALHFALGNVLAAGQRWDEAQQSYFEAAVLAPDDPDVIFNLGVALDRLHKPRLALDHYLRAEELRRSRPAAFDPRALARRITTLSQQLPAVEGSPR